MGNILYELVDNRLEPLPDTVPKGTVTNIVPIRYFGRNFEKLVETLGKIPVADQKRMKKLWDLDDDCLNKVLHTCFVPLSACCLASIHLRQKADITYCRGTTGYYAR